MRSIKRKLNSNGSRVSYYFLRYKYRWRPAFLDIFKVLKNYAETTERVKFIQIGSNDGKSGDPIFNYIMDKDWEGILVEPVKFIFEELKNTYKEKGKGIHFENSAIGITNGKQKFFRLQKVADTNAPQWYDQLGSFNKEILLKHRKYIPEIDSLLLEEEVNTITMAQLMDKYDFYKIHLLHIDTEGYDYEIVKSFPFEREQPEIILFEHKHLKETDFKAGIILLKKFGYVLYSYEWDTLAIKEQVINKNPHLLDDTSVTFSRTDISNLFRYNSLFK